MSLFLWSFIKCTDLGSVKFLSSSCVCFHFCFEACDSPTFSLVPSLVSTWPALILSTCVLLPLCEYFDFSQLCPVVSLSVLLFVAALLHSCITLRHALCPGPGPFILNNFVCLLLLLSLCERILPALILNKAHLQWFFFLLSAIGSYFPYSAHNRYVTEYSNNTNLCVYRVTHINSVFFSFTKTNNRSPVSDHAEGEINPGLSSASLWTHE